MIPSSLVRGFRQIAERHRRVIFRGVDMMRAFRFQRWTVVMMMVAVGAWMMAGREAS